MNTPHHDPLHPIGPVGPAPRRSHAPIFWLLFGAGGMLSALFGTGLVLITGFAGPWGWGPGAALPAYAKVLALAQHPLGKLALLAVVMLLAWHAAHRLLCTLHDFGIHKGLAAKSLCYGAALCLTLVAASALWRVGF